MSKPVKEEPKSQRFIESEESDSELTIPAAMQASVYQRLSKMIEKSVEFVAVSSKAAGNQLEAADIKLLRDTEPIRMIESEPSGFVVKQKKPKIKRRRLEDDDLDEKEKLRQACVTGEAVLSQEDVKALQIKKEKADKIFKYKSKKGVLYEIEPENEFSKLRKRNNWSEKKIAQSVRKQKEIKT